MPVKDIPVKINLKNITFEKFFSFYLPPFIKEQEDFPEDEKNLIAK